MRAVKENLEKHRPLKRKIVMGNICTPDGLAFELDRKVWGLASGDDQIVGAFPRR
jgi:hypothetical protein